MQKPDSPIWMQQITESDMSLENDIQQNKLNLKLFSCITMLSVFKGFKVTEKL